MVTRMAQEPQLYRGMEARAKAASGELLLSQQIRAPSKSVNWLEVEEVPSLFPHLSWAIIGQEGEL